VNRRSGHLFEGRYRCELVDTPAYFDAVASYILLNPLRARHPLADAAQTYRWSSAALSCSIASPAEWAERILAAHGGVDAVLSSLPRSRDSNARRNRRARLEAFASGKWIVGHSIRGRCTPDEYSKLLEARRAMPRPSQGNTALDETTLQAAAQTRAELTPAISQLPRCAATILGLDHDADRRQIEPTCDTSFPQPLEPPDRTTQGWGMRVYILWRFTSAPLDQLARALSRGAEEVNRAIEAVRRARVREHAWDPALWRLEWHLRLRLRAAPWRA
jgi:hypothetical protein